MRPEHVAANELVDLALAEDREGYRRKLDDLAETETPVMYHNITRMAAMQYRMQTKDYRYTGWRADWINDKRRADNNG